MALNPEQKKFETDRTVKMVRALFESGHDKTWTQEELGKVATEAMGTDGSKESVGNNIEAAGWVFEALKKGKALIQNDDGTVQITEESIFQYNNKSSFYAYKAPIGTIKIRQGSVVTII